MKRDRIQEIDALIDKRGKITLVELEELFPHTSPMTLRRDLLYLEQTGKVIRVRGGAMSVKDVQKKSNVPYTKKTASHIDEKRQIAIKAAELIDEGSCVFIDAGSTALYLAKEIPDVTCNVFTNGLAVATELSKKKNVSINLLGGPINKEHLSTSASISPLYFEDANFELAIISPAAFSFDTGFCCASQTEAELFKIVCKKAKYVYIMLDGSKVDKIKAYTFARPENIDVLITDEHFPEELKNKFKEMEIVVL